MIIAVVIPKELLGDWVYDIGGGQTELNIYIINKKKTPFIQKLFWELDKKLFKGGETLTLKKRGHNLQFVEDTKDIKVEIKNQYIFNFSDVSLVDQGVSQIKFAVDNNFNVFRQVINSTISSSYKKVALKIEQGEKEFVTSVRFHSISVSKNLDITIDTFLALIKNNIGELEIKKEKLYLKPNKPDFIQILKYYIRLCHKIIDYKFYTNQWFIAYSFSDNTIASFDYKKLNKIIPPNDRFWADPIVIYEEGVYYIFIEELLYSNNKGHISVFEIHKDGKITKPQMIIENDYHMSYPFVFTHKEQYYMIPETSHNSSIELYKATTFPYRWEFEKTLFKDIKATDSTLIEHNNSWWLFTSIKEFKNGTYDNVLNVYNSIDPINGKWEKHKLNTVKNGVENSRQGGPFIKDNKNNLYRISQNGANNYGYGFNIHKIVELNQDIYKEETVYSFEPKGESVIGVHSFSNVNGIHVFDILRRIRK